MILAAAILHKGEVYLLPAPAGHNNVIRRIYLLTGDRVTSESEQGFYDHREGFVSRRRAAEIVARGLQPTRSMKPSQELIRDGLYSEDLW